VGTGQSREQKSKQFIEHRLAEDIEEPLEEQEKFSGQYGSAQATSTFRLVTNRA
jgi:hypothetical protein